MASCHCGLAAYDEGFSGRPTWELEAEILRLTTRVMMMEREMKQVRHQMAQQTAHMQHSEETWKSKLRQQEDSLRALIVQKDREMRDISLQLLVFESGLRKEQSRIEQLLQEKDNVINRQQEELQQLKETLATFSESSEPEVPFPSAQDKTEANLLEEFGCQTSLVSELSNPVIHRSTSPNEIVVRCVKENVATNPNRRQNGPCYDVTNVWSRSELSNRNSCDVLPPSITSGSGNQSASFRNGQPGRVKPKVLPKPKHLLSLSSQRTRLQINNQCNDVTIVHADSNGDCHNDGDVQHTNSNCSAGGAGRTRALKRRYVKKQRSTAQIIDAVGLVESKGW